MNISVIITSYKEELIIGRCISSILSSTLDGLELEIIVIAPDAPTLQAAEESLQNTSFQYKILKDKGIGKSEALNTAVAQASGEVLIFTDGDIFLDQKAILNLINKMKQDQLDAIGGHPIPTNDRSTQFGFYAHLFCEAANVRRQNKFKYTPMSGYLLAVKSNLPNLFPLPANLKAEDAYISMWLNSNNYKVGYEPEALVHVLFPTNVKDWLNQKTRSLGGNIQLEQFTANLPQNHRTVKRSPFQDFSMLFFPILYAKNLKELFYAKILYFLRIYLWLNIYINHAKNNYKQGAWEQIKSTKQV